MHNPAQLITIAATALNAAAARLSGHTGCILPGIEIDPSLKGHCAAQAVLKREQLSVRINLPVMANHLDDYLAVTIPHEVSHLYLLWRSRHSRNRPRPHGPEWQEIMRSCFGLEPKRCHAYQTAPARNLPRCYLYRCHCREHQLTSIMHNRIHRRGAARCRSCGAGLQFVGKVP